MRTLEGKRPRLVSATGSTHRLRLLVLTVAFVVTAIGGSAARGAPSVTVQTFTGLGISSPVGIVAGPDGALWFTNFGNNSIGRISTTGAITNFTSPSIQYPARITAGPDGAIWFTNQYSIGRITTSGVVSSFSGPGISGPIGITAGPDGAIWFTNQYSGTIGRISIGGTVTEYSGPGLTSAGIGLITSGPDGALWFTNPYTDTLGRITTSGAITTYTNSAVRNPGAITAGEDGALWFTDYYAVGRITTDGVITMFAGADPGGGITPGPDAAVWFTNFYSSIGRIGSEGAITTYSDPAIQFPRGITLGPDRALWFTNAGDNSIGRVMLSDTTAPTLSLPSTLTVNATRPAGAVVQYTVTATDDRDPTPVVSCTPSPDSLFAIGDTVVTCTATDASGNRASGSFTVHVKDASEQLNDLAAIIHEIGGPGWSLADKIADAQTLLQAGETTATCNALLPFANEVSAQSGKHIESQVAGRLIAGITRINTVLGCTR